MKLLIIDDHEIVRKGIRMLLEGESYIEGIEEASSIEEGMQKLGTYGPDLAVVDINLGGKNGLDLVEEAMNRQMDTRFVILTSSSRRGDFERAKELGVRGYILKDSGIEDILYALRSIEKGRVFYDSKITQAAPIGEREKVLEILTDREREIFREIGGGLSNLEIANKLYISENTVKKHITSLMNKLEVKRRTEVALYAVSFWRRKGDK